MKLYRHPDLPAHWIGEDPHGALMQWPRAGRWADRTAFDGDRRRLQPARPALARGTRWPGAGKGRRYASTDGAPTRVRGVRVSDNEWKAWTDAAGERGVGEWIREVCNGAAGRMPRA